MLLQVTPCYANMSHWVVLQWSCYTSLRLSFFSVIHVTVQYVYAWYIWICHYYITEYKHRLRLDINLSVIIIKVFLTTFLLVVEFCRRYPLKSLQMRIISNDPPVSPHFTLFLLLTPSPLLPTLPHSLNLTLSPHSPQWMGWKGWEMV